jgi:hypothetical protein
MKEECDKQEQQLLTATAKYEELVMDNKILLCCVYNPPIVYSFSMYTKEVIKCAGTNTCLLCSTVMPTVL